MPLVKQGKHRATVLKISFNSRLTSVSVNETQTKGDTQRVDRRNASLKAAFQAQSL